MQVLIQSSATKMDGIHFTSHAGTSTEDNDTQKLDEILF